MLTYLEGARFKLQSALLELDHKPRGSHPLAAHIQITRDRTGLQQSILKVPLWLRNGDDTDRINQEYTDITDLATGDDNCVDGRNEVLIKHFDRNFSRSRSSMEFTGNDIVVITGGGDGGGDSGTSSTNGEKRTNGGRHSTKGAGGGGGSPVFDRGIADGGSNQPDSDFGMAGIS